MFFGARTQKSNVEAMDWLWHDSSLVRLRPTLGLVIVIYCGFWHSTDSTYCLQLNAHDCLCAFLEVLLNSHIAFVLNPDISSFRYIVGSLEPGRGGLDANILSQNAFASAVLIIWLHQRPILPNVFQIVVSFLKGKPPDLLVALQETHGVDVL
ncbi:hypothetical protein RHMOL_Rhmol09G0018500 [Rhododendron molle]|uniref:Uncharacterized protein n=1 Tax=Rhododendron molle TaxID=49168 RepID=A0ACC0M8P8_RHOML|nr:hypothetical protein RHMOL_Rhmol09G0018500 [Rhododendron molle]